MAGRRLLTWLALAAGVVIIVLLASGRLTGDDDEAAAPGQTTTEAQEEAPADTGATQVGGVTFKRGDWPTFGRTYDMNRHSPLTEITKQNVGQLGRAFSVDFKEIDRSIPLQNQTYPLVVDGIIYATTSYAHVFAIDGKTGEVLWHFKPRSIGHYRNFGLNPNRGVAYCDGKLFVLTLDMRIQSLDAKTGELVKEIDIADVVPDATTEFGYFNTAAPICYKNILLFGASGADFGIRGFFMAVTTDLEPAWADPHWTVPPEGEDWRSKGRFHGGGSTAMPAAVDPKTDTAYFPIGTASPIYFPGLRPGNNPKTNSIIAVDVFTGKEKWWRQQLGGDSWNYDTFQPPIVADATVGGQKRRVIVVATKEGVWFMYDAASGEPIYERVTLLDRVEHPALRPGEPVTVYPSGLGGVNYAPSAYDPTTNYFLNAQLETAIVLTQRRAEDIERNRIRGDVDLGLEGAQFGTVPPGWKDYGSVTAIDAATGQIAWKVKTPEPERGGVTTTAAGLAFIGGGDGVLRAFDTKTGQILWQFQTGNQMAAAPSIYEVDGKEYIAVAAGGTFTSSFGGTATRLDVFTLGGDQQQSEPPRLTEEPEPTPGTEEPDQFLSAGDEPQTLLLQVVANRDEITGEPALNGFSRGQMTVRVPAGYSVNVTFTNHLEGEPHSLVVTDGGNVERRRRLEPAFSGATIENATQGIAEGARYFRFVADRPGKYALASAVPGDARKGLWANLEVVDASARPQLVLGGDTFTIPEEEGP